MLTFLWFAAGFVSAAYLTYIFMWRDEEEFQMSVHSAIIIALIIAFGPIALFGAMLILLGEFLDSDRFERIAEYRLFTIRKKK